MFVTESDFNPNRMFFWNLTKTATDRVEVWYTATAMVFLERWHNVVVGVTENQHFSRVGLTICWFTCLFKCNRSLLFGLQMETRKLPLVPWQLHSCVIPLLSPLWYLEFIEWCRDDIWRLTWKQASPLFPRQKKSIICIYSGPVKTG